MDEHNKILDAIEQHSELVKLIYKDLAQPGVWQVGKALATVLGLGNTLLLPVRMLNERAAAVFQHNMEKYKNALLSIPEADIQGVAPELGVPLLDRLSYVSDELLSDMFVALLAKSSQTDAANDVHPAFISLIDNLSPDEARLISSLKPLAINTYGWYGFVSTTGSKNLVFDKSELLLDPRIAIEARLNFPDYGGVYLQNLKRLGILEIYENMPHSAIADVRERIINHYKGDAQTSSCAGRSGFSLIWEFGEVRYTEFGRFFRHSCLARPRNIG